MPDPAPAPTPCPEQDPEFSRLMRAVASGKLTADEAWRQWQEIQRERSAGQ